MLHQGHPSPANKASKDITRVLQTGHLLWDLQGCPGQSERLGQRVVSGTKRPKDGSLCSSESGQSGQWSKRVKTCHNMISNLVQPHHKKYPESSPKRPKGISVSRNALHENRDQLSMASRAQEWALVTSQRKSSDTLRNLRNGPRLSIYGVYK